MNNIQLIQHLVVPACVHPRPRLDAPVCAAMPFHKTNLHRALPDARASMRAAADQYRIRHCSPLADHGVGKAL